MGVSPARIDELQIDFVDAMMRADGRRGPESARHREAMLTSLREFDSPWWRFHRLVHLAREAEPERVEATRARWAPLQQELMESAYPLAERARALIESGSQDEAEIQLSAYMTQNVARMLATADELIEEFTSASVPV